MDDSKHDDVSMVVRRGHRQAATFSPLDGAAWSYKLLFRNGQISIMASHMDCLHEYSISTCLIRIHFY